MTERPREAQSDKKRPERPDMAGHSGDDNDIDVIKRTFGPEYLKNAGPSGWGHPYLMLSHQE